MEVALDLDVETALGIAFAFINFKQKHLHSFDGVVNPDCVTDVALAVWVFIQSYFSIALVQVQGTDGIVAICVRIKRQSAVFAPLK